MLITFGINWFKQVFIGLSDKVKDERNKTITYRVWDKKTGEFVLKMQRPKTAEELNS